MSPHFYLAAIELGSAWMLGWLAAAGIPIALHLLHRRRQQEVTWAAMELLLHAIQQNSRTLRIEGWLLLLLRTLALVLFALALARPLLRNQSSAVSNSAQPPRLWVVVLDTSYSMGYTSGRLSLWQQAQAAAVELVSQASDRDAFLILQLAEPSQAVISQPAFDTQRVIGEIQRLKCSDGGGDLNSCFEVLRQTLDDAAPTVSSSDMHIVFFTDMGSDTWEAATREPLKRELQELSSRYHVRIESLAPELPQNLAVTALEADSPVVLKGRALRCSATIHNYSTTAATRLPVQFQANGSTLQTEYVDCPPGAARTVVVEMQPGQQSLWSISAVLPDDALQVDNRRDLVVSVKPQVRVITVEDTGGAARLISLSLSPNTADLSGSISNRPIDVETWSSFDLQTRALGDVGAVVLTDMPELSPTAFSKLKSYVEAGGSLWIMAGPRTSPAAWNKTESSFSQLLGLNLQEPSTIGDWHIDPLNYASPITKPFANYLDSGLLTTPIFRYWKIKKADSEQEPATSSGLVTDLALDSGDPLLVRRSVGDGWIALMLSSPQSGSNSSDEASNWNAMATWPSFVPVMQKTMETLIGGSEGQLNLLVGQPLRGSTSATGPSVELSVTRPDNARGRVTVPVPINSNKRPWIYTATDRAGIYKVSVSDAKTATRSDGIETQSSERPYAVNVLPDQSDMRSVNVAALSLASGPQTSAAPSGVNLAIDDRRPDEWLVRLCLWSLLITLVSESLLAWHLGRRLNN